MSERPRRTVKPPKKFKEYIVVADLDEETANLKLQKSEICELKEKPVYKCSICSLVCRSKNEISSHFRRHKGLRNTGSFTTDIVALFLGQHSNIHKNVKPYRCEICDHESRQISVHTRHLLTHEKHPQKLFKCTICPKVFRQNEYLRQHMRKHIGEKPYECNICPKKFTAKSELNRHLVSHSSARPYSCEHCNKKFKLKHNLYAHIRAHNKVQLWKCCLCKASFPQQYLMEKHKQFHTEVVQHLELVKNDPRTISITTFPLDRRKVSHHQKMSLPPKLDLNDAQNNFNSKISLGLNDAFIPMSVIANSFGTGNYIKMKIVDKVNFSVKNCTKRLLASSGVSKAVLVEDESSLEDKNKTDKSTAPSEVTKENSLENSCKEENEETKQMKIESDYGEFFLEENEETKQKKTESDYGEIFLSHLKSMKKVFDKNHVEEIVSWLQELIDIFEKMSLPINLKILKSIQSVLVNVQNVLLSDIEAVNNSSCEMSSSTYNSSQKDNEKCTSIIQESEDENNILNGNVIASGKELKVELCRKEINEDSKRKMKDLFKCYTHLNNLINKHFMISLQL
ncbi:Zinc finger protein [Armadillidium nasatum]|uniref:Zinc finger protein n=1 Tax=Armadillidium nasatum TaxID=96803 RepID=A0A5N5TEH6_9CRUS|nr:Zinc finger protein [Armadillidium nasatum]